MMMLPDPVMVPLPVRRLRRPPPAAVVMMLLLLGTTVPASAQDDEGGLFSLPTPAPPASPYPGDSVGAPEVTIRETETEVIYEYRVKGKVYMVRIDPIAGPPYYLLDTDGDGTLDVQQQDVPDMALPQWLLFSW